MILENFRPELNATKADNDQRKLSEFMTFGDQDICNYIYNEPFV